MQFGVKGIRHGIEMAFILITVAATPNSGSGCSVDVGPTARGKIWRRVDKPANGIPVQPRRKSSKKGAWLESGDLPEGYSGSDYFGLG